MVKRATFVFYESWLNVIRDLPSDIQLEVYQAIAEYATNGKLAELKPMAKIAFAFIKQDIDRDAEKYMSIVERNRENGAKGGRPKNPKITQKTQVVISETQKNPNNLDNDNDNDNDNDDDNDDDNISTKKDWRDNFEIYKSELREAYRDIQKNKEWIDKQQEYYPNVDILKSIEKSCVNFWGTEAGWKHKKKSKYKSVDWNSTFANTISQNQNKVYKNTSNLGQKTYDKF